MTPPPPAGLRVENLLLGLGTGLLAVAAVVFTAVNWDRLDAGLQAVALLVATAVLAAATVAAARHRMPATAEAVGLVTLVMALVDAHAVRVGGLPQVDAVTYWAVALAVVAGAAWALALVSGIAATRLSAVVLGQLPLLLGLVATQASTTAGELALLGQVAVVLGLAHVARRSAPAARALAAAVAACTWSAVVTAATLQLLLEGPGAGPTCVLAGATACAGLVAWWRQREEPVRLLALVAASVVGAEAVATALAWALPAGWWTAALAGLAAGVVAIGLRAPARWGAAPAGVAALVGVTASLPLADATFAALDAALQVAEADWGLDAATSARGLSHDGSLVAAGPLATHLVALAALVLALAPRIGRRAVELLLGATAALAVVVAPLLLPLDVRGTALLTGGAAVVAAVATLVRGRTPVLRAVGATMAAGLGALAGAWSLASPELSAVGAASIAGAAVVLVVAARTHGDRTLGPVAMVVAVTGGAAAVGTAVVGLGPGGRAGLGAAGATAVGLALLAATVLDPLGSARDEDGDLSWAAEGAGWLLHLAVLFQLLVVAGPDAASVVLGSGALAAGIHAIRPGRRPMVAVAAGEGLLLVWLQLASAGVGTAEAYTLPAAAALLAAGLVAQRRAAARDRLLPSWATIGPALVVAFTPTVVLAFGDPGLVRPLAGLAAGAIVLAAGAVTGRRAPVDVGAAVVTVLGLRQLAPVAAELPSWSVLAATGAFLVVLGATFEQRRRDLHDARHRYADLR